tara:strand:- start:203 stop:829 length:627 start_codon:yes stop_codon:yes gene_type:complete
MKKTLSKNDQLKNDNSKHITKEEMLGCISKDRTCQKSIYNKTYSKLMATSYRLCKNDKQLSEDLLQDAYVKMFKNIHQIKLEDFHELAVYAWCKRVLVNIIYDYYRRQKRYPTSSIEEVNFSHPIDTGKDESDYCKLKNIDASDIVSAMQTLSPQYRLVFEMYLVDGYSHAEISKQLKIGEGTSKSNLHKAKKKVKKELDKITNQNYN